MVQGGPCHSRYVLFVLGFRRLASSTSSIMQYDLGEPLDQFKGCLSFCTKRLITSDMSTLCALFYTLNEAVLIYKSLMFQVNQNINFPGYAKKPDGPIFPLVNLSQKMVDSPMSSVKVMKF